MVLVDWGLIAAIRADAAARLQPIGVDVQVNVIGSRRRLGQQLELTLFRIVQEAINNIAKHANAQQTSLVLEFQDSIVKVIVEDDGQGFDLEKTSSPEDKMRGLGLLGMIERANLAGGSLEIESYSGRGTRIVVSMPVPPEKT
jgi:signal transduction histidine kinase